jgi:hypothetical protein
VNRASSTGSPSTPLTRSRASTGQYDRDSRSFRLEGRAAPRGLRGGRPPLRSFHAPGVFVPTPLVNRMRNRVRAWRQGQPQARQRACRASNQCGLRTWNRGRRMCADSRSKTRGATPFARRTGLWASGGPGPLRRPLAWSSRSLASDAPDATSHHPVESHALS